MNRSANRPTASQAQDAPVRMVVAKIAHLGPYLELLEEISGWMRSRNFSRWERGTYKSLDLYFAGSIEKREVYLAYLGDALVGTLRLVDQDPIVWPEITRNDALYVHNLAVRRRWAGRQLGRALLAFAGAQARARSRHFVRLDCLADNVFLPTYYEDAGFVGRGEVDAFYDQPIGLIRLRRFEKRISEGGTHDPR